MNVRFASESRHRLSALGRPLCGTTGREEAQQCALFDHLVGAGKEVRGNFDVQGFCRL